MRRGTVVVTGAVVLATVGGGAEVVPSSAGGEPAHVADTAHLSAADRRALRQRASDRPSSRVRLLLTSRPGKGDSVAAAVKDGGGRVRMADPRAGVVVADVTAAQALHLDDAASVTAAAFERGAPANAGVAESDGSSTDVAGLEVRPAGESGSGGDDPPPGPVNPYLPSGEIGAPQFVRSDPRRDGRGVRIAILDRGAPDWTSPVLRATSTDARKVTRYYDTTSRFRIDTSRTVGVAGRLIRVDGQRYVLPHGIRGHAVRFGLLAEPAPRYEGDTEHDLNLDGDQTDAFAVAVLDSRWRGPRALVDTDQDRSFADERWLADWNASQATATFGRDNPDTADRIEVRPFGLNLCQTRGLGPCAEPGPRRGDAWSLVTPGQLATYKASVTAGHDFRLLGGRFDGVAPGAEVWAFETQVARDASGNHDDVTLTALTRAMLIAAQQGADIIDIEVSLSSAGDSVIPSNVLGVVIDNITAAYGVPVVADECCGGQGRGVVNTIAGAATTAITVGTVLSGENLAALSRKAGLDGERTQLAAGPNRFTGRYGPDVLAPNAAFVAVPRWEPLDAYEYWADRLPVGFGAVAGRPSSFTAGAVALLISAARAERVPYSPRTLKRALELGARPVRNMPADAPDYAGHGVVDVGAAWQWLKRLSAQARDPERGLTTNVAADVVAGSGPAIYQRTSVRDVEQVTLSTLHDPRTRRYELRSDQPWIRPERTDVELPGARGGTPGKATFNVEIDRSIRDQPGTHLGVVTIDDPATPDPADHELHVVVLTPLRFDPANNRIHLSADSEHGIETLASREFFIAIPPGARKLSITNSRPLGDPAGVALWAVGPDGKPGRDEHGHSAPQVHTPDPGKSIARTFNAQAGTWGLVFTTKEDATGPALVPRHAYDVTISLDPPQ